MEHKQDEEIKRFVKEVREVLQITQPELAGKLSCTKGNVSAWENGRHQPSYAQMMWMSEQSGVPMPHDKTAKILKELGVDINKLQFTNIGLLKAAVNVPKEDEAQAEQILTTFGDRKEKESRERNEGK